MAKFKMISIQNLLINYKINRNENKIKDSNIYYEIVKERELKKLENDTLQLKQQHQDILDDFYLGTINDDSYYEFISKSKIEKLDKRFYWKKRALIQSMKRKNIAADSSNSQFIDKEKELNKKYEKKKESIINHIKRLPLTTKELEDNTKLYKKELKRYDEELASQIKLWKTITDKKLNNAKKHVNLKINKAEKTIETLLSSKSEVTNTLAQSIDQDVVLSIQELTMKFGGLVAVDNLSFDVKEGEIFGLIGPNGAGKTTVFNCITQFYKSNHGTLLFRDSKQAVVNLNDYKVHNIIRHGISRTFQNVELIWEISILDNMLVAGHSLYRSGFFGHLFHSVKFRREEKVLTAKAVKILKDLGIYQYKDFYPIGLPYGILKTVEFARTLMTDPRLVILDEPAAGLNDMESKELVKLIKKIQKDYQCTIFLVEHDMGLVMDLCDTVCAISFGKMLAIGTPAEIQKNKLVQDAYLGGE